MRPSGLLCLGMLAILSLPASAASGLPAPAGEEDFYPRDPAREELGRLLFFDKLLSGNRNTSCATCHHPLAGTTDWLSLPIGEGGFGLGTTRDTGQGADAVHERVPRNAPHVFNLGAREFVRMFHDGRAEVDPTHPTGFVSPAGDDLPPGLDNVLAVQAMFPVTSGAEMAGQGAENPVAAAAAVGDLAGPAGVWNLLADRLRDNSEYVELFIDAFDDVSSAGDITFVHAANAIASFEAGVWRFDNSPFDRYLRGEPTAMSAEARQGMQLFYGKAGCSTCHSGTFQTDHDFHAVGVPQIGPGKGDNLPGYTDGLDDLGRERVTGQPADRFAFRTPTLRNVAVTGPWGHDGAFNTLEGMVRHLMDPAQSIEEYDESQLQLPSRADLDAIDLLCHNDPARRATLAAYVELQPIKLKQREVDRLLAFLHALTDPRVFDLRSDVPTRVPSGLSLAE